MQNIPCFLSTTGLFLTLIIPANILNLPRTIDHNYLASGTWNLNMWVTIILETLEQTNKVFLDPHFGSYPQTSEVPKYPTYWDRNLAIQHNGKEVP